MAEAAKTVEVAFAPHELDALITELISTRRRWSPRRFETEHGKAVSAALATLVYQRLMAQHHGVIPLDDLLPGDVAR